MLPHWRSAPCSGLLTVALTVLACAPLRAQTATTGAVDGRIVDAAGAPVLDAIVTIRDPSAGIQKETDSGRRGVFSFGYLAPGVYELRAEQIGYAPGLVTGIQVRPGRTRHVEVRLPASAAADARPRVLAHEGAVQPATLYGGSQWLPSSAVRAIPSAGREPTDLLRMFSIADDRWVAEGLPASLSVLRVDGIPFRPAAHPQLPEAGTFAFTVTGIESAELVTNGVAVDWGGAAASFLSAQTRRGASAATVHAAAFWSGDALPSGVDAGSLSHTDIQGGVVVRGPLFADGNHFSLGIEARRLETPVSAAWADTEAAAALTAADPDLESYRTPAVLSSNAVSAFARADWSAGRSHRVELSAHFAAQPDADTVDDRGSRLAWQGSDLVAGAALRSAFGASVVNELRLAATRSVRERPALDQGIPTRLVSDDLAFGAATESASSAEDLIVHVSDAVRVASGAHALEVGAAAALGMYSYEHRENATGTYLFGDLSDFEAGTGVFTRAEGGAPLAEWTSPTLSVFAQDRWRALSGLEVLLGVRVDRESLPESDVSRDDEWFQLTGLANNDIGSTSLRISPRAGITWDVNGSRDWVVEAGGGLYYDRVDPQLLAQWQIDDGSASVRRVSGALSWPDDASAGATAPRLTMLASDFDAPRTARLGAGVTRRLAAGTSLSVSAVARRTENLPRQSDLNLLPLPTARDQYGREVYGTLEQHGALLIAAPASGRRFPDYDEVALISDDGWSEYIGVTIGVDRELMDGYGFLLRYTFGRTTDNWVDAAGGRWGHSGAPAVGDDPDWEEGTSDFDVPHRGTAALVFEAPFGLRVSGAYRFQSGRPFTPGFRPGVDADAGGAGTDPAFVDGTLAGMSDIIGEWDCLRDAEDAFVERNSCRAASVHALDLGASLTVLRWGGAAAAITLDAFNVLDTWHEQPDAALYLIDPAGTLTSDPVARTVDVPLLVNSEFGKPLARRHSGRRLRLGLSLNW